MQASKLKPELPRQSSVDSRDEAGNPSGVPVEVDDTAMFERKRPAPSLTDSVFQMKKVSYTAQSFCHLAANVPLARGGKNFKTLKLRGMFLSTESTQTSLCVT